MRKKLTSILTCVILICLALAVFTACDTTNNDNGDEQILAVYNTYVAQMEEDGETPLSYEQWLKTIKGDKGEKGDAGQNGTNGKDGKDGVTPTIEISSDGFWVINGTKTKYKAIGVDGQNGTNGTNGKDGRGIVTAIINEDGDLIITYNDGTSENAGNLIVKNPTIDENNKIVFKTFTVEENIVYGKVANGTEYFSFIDEIELVGSASYIVSTDIFGLNQIPNKIVALESGDNTFYIREECGNAIKVYKVLIRKDLHIVTFNTNNGTAIEPLTVETGEIISTPALTKNGYGLSWDFDFNTPITSDITINATWSAIFTISNNSITGLTEYGKSLKEIDIQPTIDGVNITSIGKEAFLKCSNLTSVIIGNGVTSIGIRAFYNCSGLTSIIIPSSVASISIHAFAGCYSLTNVNYIGTIDEWVQIEYSDEYSTPLQYAENLYINYELVSEVNITTATGINGYAFYRCDSLTSVTIGNSVEYINNYAFCNGVEYSSLYSICTHSSIVPI